MGDLPGSQGYEDHLVTLASWDDPPSMMPSSRDEVWLRRNFASKLVIGIPQRVLPNSGALGCFTALLSLSVELQAKQRLGEAVQMVHEELQRARKEALRGEVGCLEEGRWQLACR